MAVPDNEKLKHFETLGLKLSRSEKKLKHHFVDIANKIRFYIMFNKI
jgi:hypothetical protein